MKGLAEIKADNAPSSATVHADKLRKAALRRLEQRVLRVMPPGDRYRRALALTAIRGWDKAERKSGGR